MKITELETIDKYEGRGYGSSRLEINLETDAGSWGLDFGGGEPEDNCLARDLKGAYYIKQMLTKAYEAGRSGEELVVEESIEE